MNQNEELTGTMVLVHPELADDPVHKQGKPGMIMYAEMETDDVYVTFGKGERALYGSDALLVFKKPMDIFQDLMANTKEIPISDLKALYRINLLLDSGQSKDVKEAMQLAADNPGVQGRSMVSLQEKLGLTLAATAEPEQSFTQNRGR